MRMYISSQAKVISSTRVMDNRAKGFRLQNLGRGWMGIFVIDTLDKLYAAQYLASVLWSKRQFVLASLAISQSTYTCVWEYTIALFRRASCLRGQDSRDSMLSQRLLKMQEYEPPRVESSQSPHYW